MSRLDESHAVTQDLDGASGGPRGYLLQILAEPGAQARVLPPAGELVIGRGEGADIRIEDPSVSRRHALLRIDDALWLEDLGGTNGTRVGDRRLGPKERVRVLPGEIIDLGRVMLVIQARRHVAEPSRPAASAATEQHGIVARDPAMRRLLQLLARVAPGNISVLVLGETGVGKELVAEALHRGSPRAPGPLVRLNCGALNETLLESELFGHEKGAFTGADRAKPGLLETADRGTAFLDEVGELPPRLQVKLLRVLEDRIVQRVGAVGGRTIDVRFVFATNRDLEAEVEAGRFRRDLYFRLNGVTLFVPPLRERPLDLRPLSEHFLRRACELAGRPAPVLSDEAVRALEAHPWPGNVRELRNAIERALLLAPGEIRAEHLRLEGARLPEAAAAPAAPTAPQSLKGEVTALERQRIVDALDACGGNQTRAAKLLGISRRTLVNRIEQFGLPRPRK